MPETKVKCPNCGRTDNIARRKLAFHFTVPSKTTAPSETDAIILPLRRTGRPVKIMVYCLSCEHDFQIDESEADLLLDQDIRGTCLLLRAAHAMNNMADQLPPREREEWVEGNKKGKKWSKEIEQKWLLELRELVPDPERATEQTIESLSSLKRTWYRWRYKREGITFRLLESICVAAKE